MSRTYVDYLKIVLCLIFILALSACEPQFNNQTGRAPSSSVQSTQTTPSTPLFWTINLHRYCFNV
jgi:hypothetical protein